MNKILDKLQQLALNRLTTRLKHLRGKHDQLDHAWNRGMGQGGGGVGLAPNQMGPLPTADFYRKRRIELMSQQRQGEITRTEMRQQMRDLRGITVDALETQQNNVDIDDAKQRLRELRQEEKMLVREVKFHQNKLDYVVERDEQDRRNKILEVSTDAWVQTVTSLFEDIVNKIADEVKNRVSSSEELSYVDANLLKEIEDLQNQIQYAINNPDMSYPAKAAFVDDIHRLLVQTQSYSFTYIKSAIEAGEFSPDIIKFLEKYNAHVLRGSASMFARADDSELGSLDSRLYDFYYWMSLSNNIFFNKDLTLQLMDDFRKKIETVQAEPSVWDQQIQEHRDDLQKFENELSQKRIEIQELRSQIPELNDVNNIYSDSVYQPFYDPELIPPETRELTNVYESVRNAIEDSSPETRTVVEDLGLDVDDPRDMQMLGDLLGAFSASPDGASSSTMRMDSFISHFSKDASGEDKIVGASIYLSSDVSTTDGKIEVKRSLMFTPTEILISNSFFKQSNMRGTGRAALTRQISAAIRLSRMTGKPVKIEANAVSRPPDYNGYHVWPKMSFNFSMNSGVAEILDLLGFPDYELTDTFSFMLSSRRADVSEEALQLARNYGLSESKMRALDGKTPQEIWGDIVDMVIQTEGSVEEMGYGYIDASDPDNPLIVENIMLEYYNEYLRQKQRAASKSIKDKKYLPYLESQGFSMEDMEAFEYAWAMARKRGVIK